MDFLAIEVEGLPDIAGARRLYGLPAGLADEDVAKVIFHHHLHGHRDEPFLAPHLRAIAVVGVVSCRDERLRQDVLSAAPGDESNLLEDLARMVGRARGPVIVWDGQRNIVSWLGLRALVQATTWRAPVTRRLESELGLTDARTGRHELGRRLGIVTAEIPDDESHWRLFRTTGGSASVERCALNAAATAALWLRCCLIRGHLTAEEHQALCAELGRLSPPVTDAA